MVQSAEAQRIWDALEAARYCMLIDRFKGGLRARPMAHKVEAGRGALWFVTARDSAKVEEIQRAPEVCITVTDSQENLFLSASGRAELLEDAAKKRDLWTPAFDAYFPNGPEDPSALLLRVDLHKGELWLGLPASIDAVETVLSGVTGARPDLESGAGQSHTRADL